MAVHQSALVHRFARGLLQETLADTPVTVVQGARQVGKSTLARQLVAQSPDAAFVSLDAEGVYNAAKADPETFVRQQSRLLVFDEVQRVPSLLRAIKDAVDEDRRPGRYLVTGSANLLQLPGAQESLAGRAETVVLYGLSQGELNGKQEDFVDLLMNGAQDTLAARPATLERHDYLDVICAGSYPEPRTRTGRRRRSWFDNYLNRIISRDAADVSQLGHLQRLPDLVRLLAANNAGEFVKSRFAEDLQIHHGSVDAYLTLLETLYLAHRLPAWGHNLAKRVIGRPKAALLDTGLAARLVNVTPQAMTPGSTASGLAGGLFEAFVAGELRRQLTWSQSQPQMFHFRERDGIEVDVVLEDASRNVAGIEVKAGASVNAGDFKGLAFLRDKLGDRFRLGVLLHTGTRALPFGDRLCALPLQTLWS